MDSTVTVTFPNHKKHCTKTRSICSPNKIFLHFAEKKKNFIDTLGDPDLSTISFRTLPFSLLFYLTGLGARCGVYSA